MKKITSKFIVTTFFVGIFVFTALIGVFKNIDFSNEANIYIHGQKTQIENIYKRKINGPIGHNTSLYDEEIDGGEDTGDGEGDTGDGESDDTTQTPSTSSKKESQAEWAQIAFMTAALSGTYGFAGDNYKYEGNTEIIYDDTILFSDNQDWNQTDIVKFITYSGDEWDSELTLEQQKYAKLYNYSAGIKFYTETMGKTTGPVFIDEYISDLTETEDSDTMNSVQLDMNTYFETNRKGLKTLKDLKSFYGNGSIEQKELVKKDFMIIINTKDYRMEVTSFLYTYAYLWQDSNSTVYDYKLTEELVSLRPSFVWQQDVDISGTDESIYPTAFDAAVDGQLNDGELPTTENANWNSWETDLTSTDQRVYWDIKNDDYSQLPNGLVGYRGIQTQNNSALTGVDNQFWNFKREFNYEDDRTTINSDSQLLAAQGGDAMLYEKWSGSSGTYLIGGEESSYTLAHSIIAPYVYAEGYNEETGLANKWEYSLYGDKQQPTNTGDVEVKKTNEESIESSIFSNYSPLIFTSDSSFTKDEQYGLTALYIVYSIYNAESNSETGSNPLLNNSYKYWNDQGFYIELTGSYYDDYSNLLPKLIQKDYGKE